MKWHYGLLLFLVGLASFLESYLSSASLFGLAESKVLVLGDCHVRSVEDTEHTTQLLSFFDQFEKQNKKSAVILEGNALTARRLHTAGYEADLLLIASWLYGYEHAHDSLTFHFADPRLLLLALYKRFFTGIELRDFAQSNSRGIDALFEEFQYIIARCGDGTRGIQHLDVKRFIETMLVRMKRGYLILKEFLSCSSLLNVKSYDALLLELQEAIEQSNLDTADSSFCLKLYQELGSKKDIIILVGEDHTIRVMHMLEQMGYKETSIGMANTIKCKPGLLPNPLEAVYISSYFDAFLA